MTHDAEPRTSVSGPLVALVRARWIPPPKNSSTPTVFRLRPIIRHPIRRYH